MVASGLCVQCQKTWAARTIVPRPELLALAHIPDADARLFLLFRLRSNIDSDQEIARVRCQQYGVEYDKASDEARRS